MSSSGESQEYQSKFLNWVTLIWSHVLQFFFNIEYTFAICNLTVHPKTPVIYGSYISIRLFKTNILYNARVLDKFCRPAVPRYATGDAVGLLIPLLQLSPTRNYVYNHSQLFLMLCHNCTAYSHTRSWLQSLITPLHVYTGDISAINCFLKLSQTLYLHTSKFSPKTYSANSLLKTAT
jgi:hypothetical protein